jgi:hypothetical protein
MEFCWWIVWAVKTAKIDERIGFGLNFSGQNNQ